MKIILLSLLLISTATFAQVDPIDKSGLAIGGYDLVAYFNAGKAVKGDPQFSWVLGSTTYLFSTRENLDAFKATPLKYLPQYEGFCALAVSYGKKISVDPKTFKVIDNKLYLFFHGKSGGRMVNSLEAWNKNEPRLLQKAESLWPDVKKIKYDPKKTL